MNKKASFLFGITLVIIAFLALGALLLANLDGMPEIKTGVNTWPLFVIGAGLLFCIPPFLYREKTGLGGLFIPGAPILTTGILLFITSITDRWDLWATWWPIEVIGVALGFILAAIFLRVVWLLLPASIVGLTGLALLFTSLTGLWVAWSVIWTVVPFSVGLPMLLIGLVQKNEGVKLAGIILCGFAGLAFAAMSAFIPSENLVLRMIGPIIIFSLGALLIITAAIQRSDKVKVEQVDVESEEVPDPTS